MPINNRAHLKQIKKTTVSAVVFEKLEMEAPHLFNKKNNFRYFRYSSQASSHFLQASAHS